MHCNFLLGKLIVESDVRDLLGRTPLDLVARHAICEHGIVGPRRLKINADSAQHIGEIQSEYLADPTDPSKGTVVVTTSDDWSETTVRLKKAPRTKRPPTNTRKGSDDFPV